MHDQINNFIHQHIEAALTVGSGSALAIVNHVTPILEIPHTSFLDQCVSAAIAGIIGGGFSYLIKKFFDKTFFKGDK